VSEPRRVAGMPSPDYFAAPGISSTDLKQWVSMTPREWRHWKDNRDSAPTEAMQLGSAIHCAVLEPDEYASRFCAYDGRKAGKAYEEYKALNGHKTVLSKKSQGVVNDTLDYLREHDRLHSVIKHGESEVSYFAPDPVHERVRKARADWIGDLNGQRLLIDLKTTWSLDDRHIQKTLHDMNYHMQAAYYLDTVGLVEGQPPSGFAILWIRTTPPVDMRVSIVGNATLEVGREKYQHAFCELHQAIASGEFPGYPAEPSLLELPAWALKATTDE
jgi:hypothetical protein